MRKTEVRRTAKQKSLREHVEEGIEFESAVLVSVKTLFRFTHRATEGKALWSDENVVWLGRNTFLHWCLEDTAFDLPWIVGKTKNAPRDRAKLKERIKDELTDYFGDQLAALPRKKTGSWLPLP